MASYNLTQDQFDQLFQPQEETVGDLIGGLVGTGLLLGTDIGKEDPGKSAPFVGGGLQAQSALLDLIGDIITEARATGKDAKKAVTDGLMSLRGAADPNDPQAREISGLLDELARQSRQGSIDDFISSLQRFGNRGGRVPVYHQEILGDALKDFAGNQGASQTVKNRLASLDILNRLGQGQMQAGKLLNSLSQGQLNMGKPYNPVLQSGVQNANALASARRGNAAREGNIAGNAGQAIGGVTDSILKLAGLGKNVGDIAGWFDGGGIGGDIGAFDMTDIGGDLGGAFDAFDTGAWDAGLDWMF